MISLFKRKEVPKIEFYSLIPGLEEIHPPIRAKEDVLPKWIKTHSGGTKTLLDDENSLITQSFRIERCPGIRGILEEGISVKVWQDIKIKVSKDGQYQWESPSKTADLINGKYMSPEVQAHSGDQFPEYCTARKDSWPHIIKIMTNWRVSITQGWQFLMLPNYYSDNQWFSAVPGIYNPEYGRHINVNIQLHREEGVFFFPSGTTICKMIPVKKNQKFDLKIRRVNEEDVIKETAAWAAVKKRFWASRKEQAEDIKNIYANSSCPFLTNLFHKK